MSSTFVIVNHKFIGDKAKSAAAYWKMAGEKAAAKHSSQTGHEDGKYLELGMWCHFGCPTYGAVDGLSAANGSDIYCLWEFRAGLSPQQMQDLLDGEFGPAMGSGLMNNCMYTLQQNPLMDGTPATFGPKAPNSKNAYAGSNRIGKYDPRKSTFYIVEHHFKNKKASEDWWAGLDMSQLPALHQKWHSEGFANPAFMATGGQGKMFCLWEAKAGKTLSDLMKVVNGPEVTNGKCLNTPFKVNLEMLGNSLPVKSPFQSMNMPFTPMPRTMPPKPASQFCLVHHKFVGDKKASAEALWKMAGEKAAAKHSSQMGHEDGKYIELGVWNHFGCPTYGAKDGFSSANGADVYCLWEFKAGMSDDQMQDFLDGEFGPSMGSGLFNNCIYKLQMNPLMDGSPAVFSDGGPNPKRPYVGSNRIGKYDPSKSTFYIVEHHFKHKQASEQWWADLNMDGLPALHKKWNSEGFANPAFMATGGQGKMFCLWEVKAGRTLDELQKVLDGPEVTNGKCLNTPFKVNLEMMGNMLPVNSPFQK